LISGAVFDPLGFDVGPPAAPWDAVIWRASESTVVGAALVGAGSVATLMPGFDGCVGTCGVIRVGEDGDCRGGVLT
jgi:hypothetical protein